MNNKIKKITFSVLAFITINCVADNVGLSDAQKQWTTEYFNKQGHPAPDSGLQIIPVSQMINYNEIRKIRDKKEAEIKKFGYIHQPDDSVDFLKNINSLALKQFVQHENDYDPRNTHMRKNIGDLKMAYTFYGVPQIAKTKTIGYAPYLNYIEQQGWAGAAEFFNNKAIGNCVYYENNIKLSHGAAILPEEDVEYLVNGKPTTFDVIGTENSGFSYKIMWFDNTFFREVQCENDKYLPDLKKVVVKLATQIDNGWLVR